MSILVISSGAKEVIAQVKSYAEKNRYTLPMMKLRVTGDLSPPGDDPGFVGDLHSDFRVVYSIEQYCDKNWYAHLSVSISKKDRAPSIPAVEMIMEEFGMGNDIHDVFNVSMEEIGEGLFAVNIIKELEE